MTATRTITVIGSVNMDLVVETDRLPREGETVLGSTFRVVPGGKGANQAVAAARLGARVSFVGCVGDDAYGRLARRNLREQGVATRRLRTVDGHTGVALIMVGVRPVVAVMQPAALPAPTPASVHAPPAPPVARHPPPTPTHQSSPSSGRPSLLESGQGSSSGTP